MAHIVFVMRTYLPEFDANVNCTNNIMTALKNKGHKISCVCGSRQEEEYCLDGINVHKVKHICYEEKYKAETVRQKRFIRRVLHFLYSVLILPLFPNVEPLFSFKLYRELNRIDKNERIDIVIGVFRPFASIKAATFFGKKHKDIHVIGYYLDILKGAVKPVGIPRSVYEKLCDIKEKNTFSKLDLILMAENGRVIYDSDPHFADCKNIEYVNFPTLIVREETPAPINKDSVKLFYAGYMDSHYRNPIVLLDAIVELRKIIPDVELHIYGKSDMEQVLHGYADKYSDFIFYYGQAEKSVVDEKMMHADLLVNIGNDISGIVPSKVFELIATRKPIIYFTDSSIDSALAYFEMYPNVCIIEKKLPSETAAEKISDFVSSDPSPASCEYLREKYFSATPDAVVKLIEEVIARYDTK